MLKSALKWHYSASCTRCSVTHHLCNTRMYMDGTGPIIYATHYRNNQCNTQHAAGHIIYATCYRNNQCNTLQNPSSTQHATCCRAHHLRNTQHAAGPITMQHATGIIYATRNTLPDPSTMQHTTGIIYATCLQESFMQHTHTHTRVGCYLR